MKKQIVFFLISLLSLCLGLLIYACTRTDSLYLNQIFGPLGGKAVRNFFQDFISRIHLPYWFIYSLPDALWMLALTLVVMMIWNFKLDRQSLPWIGGAICLGILFEIGQGMHLIRGTFDIVDLIGICIGALIPVSLTLLNKRLSKVNETAKKTI